MEEAKSFSFEKSGIIPGQNYIQICGSSGVFYHLGHVIPVSLSKEIISDGGTGVPETGILTVQFRYEGCIMKDESDGKGTFHGTLSNRKYNSIDL